MSAALRTPERSPPRATGFASAVLLVVLLATTGLPVEAARRVEAQQVTCCMEPRGQSAARRGEPATRLPPPSCVPCLPAPRVAPRAARVESWGRPPARAPTARR